jgi:hypothetical protein
MPSPLRSVLLAVAAAALAVAVGGAAAPARAESAEVSFCGYSAVLPGEPHYFKINQTDPFGRSGVLEGAEAVLGRAAYARFDCFRADSPAAPPRRDQAIFQIFEYTKSLGITKQSYQYQSLNGRVSLLVNGERTFGNDVYAIRMEFQFLRSVTLSVVSSRRVGDRKTAALIDQFIESFRLGRAEMAR